MAQKIREFDYEEVEKAAEESPTRSEFCRRVGIHASHFAQYCKSNPKLKYHYGLGVARRADGGTIKPKGANKSELLVKATAEDFHGYGLQKLKFKRIAEILETNAIGVSQHFHHFPDLRRAYEKGKQGIAFGLDNGALGDLQNIASLGDIDEEKRALRLETAAAVEKALELKLYFLPDIAEYLSADRTEIFNVLSEMIAGGTVERAKSGESFVYFLKNAAEAEPVPASTPVADRAPRDKVLSAVKSGCNLSRAICLETGLSIDTVLEELEVMEDTEIAVRRETSFTAYFPVDELPDGKLILDGKGGITVGKIESKVADEVWKQKQRELDLKNEMARNNPRPAPVPVPVKSVLTLPEEFGDETDFAAEFSDDLPETPELVFYCLECTAEITDKPFEFLNGDKYCSAQCLQKASSEPEPSIRETPENTEIIEEQTIQKENKIIMKTEAVKAEAQTTKQRVKKQIEYASADFKEFGRRNLSPKKIADHYGVVQSSITWQMKKDHLREAYEAGLAEFRSAPEAKIEPVEPVAEIREIADTPETGLNDAAPESNDEGETISNLIDGDIEISSRHDRTISYLMKNDTDETRAGIAKTVGQLMDTKVIIPELAREHVQSNGGATVNSSAQIRKISLSNGKTVVMGFDGNFFEMSARERKLMNRMADLADDYETGE